MFNKYFRCLYFYIILLVSTTVVNILYASTEESPSFFSPGKRVSSKVGEQLLALRPNIVELFGEEVVESDYEILFKQPPPVGESSFRSSLFRIKRVLERRLGEGELVIHSFGEITRIRNDLEGIPEERLEHYAREYFERMDGFEEIKFTPKVDGDQLGSKAIVTISGRSTGVYIKTHSLGHKLLSRSTGAHRLNPIELIVYAILEHLGDGPKVHFFGRDDKNAFIATEYAGKEAAEFHTYEHHLKEPKRKEDLWGSEAFSYITSTPHDGRDMSSLMGIIDSNPQSKDLADRFTRVDIISRIFRLSDLIGNTGNFGFEVRADGTIKYSIIDFRIIPDERGEYSINEGNLNGFYKGNGIFSPLSADPFVRHVLSDRPAAIRADRVLHHITEIQTRLPEALAASTSRVMGFIDSILGNVDDAAEFRAQSNLALTQYGEALVHNAERYLEYISKGAPEI